MDDAEGQLAEEISAAEFKAQTFGYYDHVASIERLPSRHFVADFGLQLIDESGNDGPTYAEAKEAHFQYVQSNGGYEFPRPPRS